MRFIRNLVLVCFALAAAGAGAQTSVPANQVSPLKEPGLLKPPAGAKVAILEYADLECPFCARAFPLLHIAARQYGIPMIEYDFQIPYHRWSHDAAITAHYLKARVSPDTAEEYRRQVFAMQTRISSRDDLHAFTQAFFAKQKLTMPATIDPTGAFGREVDASTETGKQIGVDSTPSIFVVTASHWIEVKDPMLIDEAIRQAQAEAGR